MKKVYLFFVLFFLCFTSIKASNFVFIGGQLTNNQTGLSIPNHAVLITDSINYSHIVFTDNLGNYYDSTFNNSPNPAIYYIIVYDCNNVTHSDSIISSSNIFNTVNFNICYHGENLGINNINIPQDTIFYTGTYVSPSIVIQNYDTVSVHSFHIAYSINGQSPVIETYTGLLHPDSIMYYSFTNGFIAPSSNFSFCAYLINNDNNPLNDTMCKTIAIISAAIDVGITSIIYPDSNTTAGNLIAPKIKIKNFGTQTVTSMQLGYSKPGYYYPIYETWTGNLQHDSTIIYTFSNTYVSPSSNYFITAFTHLAGDSIVYNDSLYKYVEVNPAQLDVSIIDIVSPGSYTCTGALQEVKVIIKNFGSTPLTSIPVSYRRLPLTQISEIWTGNPLQYGDTVHYTFTSQFNVPGGGTSFALCAYVTLANDANKSNDTICKSEAILSPISLLTVTGEDTVVIGQNNVSYIANTYPNYLNPTTQCIWTLPTGAILDSANNNTIIVNYGNNALSGNITCKIISICGVTPTVVLPIHVFATPPTPIIYQNGTMLYSNYVTGNQWYDANGAILGENQQTYSPSVVGDYYTKVTLAGITSLPSNIIHFSFIGIDDHSEIYGFKLFPNPFVSNTTFYYSLKEKSNVHLSIIDITGKEIIVLYENNEERGEHQIQFNAENFKSGIYFYRLKIGENNIDGKLLIVK